MLIAINFHYIRESFNEPYPSIFGITPKQFSDRLDQLGRYADFLSIEDIINIIEGRKKLPEKSIVITFDDGFKEQYEHAWPILKKKGIPAIFYVNTQPIEKKIVTTTHKIHILRAYTSPKKLKQVLENILSKNNISIKYPSIEKAKRAYKYDKAEVAKLKFYLNHSLDHVTQQKVVNDTFIELGFNEAKLSNDLYMTKSMVNELAQFGVIGTHGHSHLPLGLLRDEDAIEDFENSLRILKDWTGLNIKTLSYPFGYKEACSKAVSISAVKSDVRFAFTMERAGNPNIKVPHFLARFSNSDLPKDRSNDILDEFWENIPHAKWYQ